MPGSHARRALAETHELDCFRRIGKTHRGSGYICPARESDNLERLARALAELRARIRTAGVPEGLAFACDATFLSRIEVVLNLTTKFGDLALSFIPSGTSGFADLHPQAVPMSLMGRPIAVASLADVIRSKEAANRPKDQIVLPALRLLLERTNPRGGDR